jgi:Flp pilus assembly protein TadG
MMRPLLNRLRRFFARTDGAAAVELAFLTPLFVVLVTGIIQYGGMVIAFQRMHNGVAAGALYVMRGGTDATSIHDIAVGGWPNAPADAAVTVTQSCLCAGVTSSCSAVCAGNVYPQAQTVIAASGTYTGMFGNKSMTTSQLIRTQ